MSFPWTAARPAAAHTRTLVVVFVVGLAALSACAPTAIVTFDARGPALTVRRPALYPETLLADVGRDGFLVSSFREGAIYRVDPGGRPSLLVDDPRLSSVLGIAVDAAR